jgi:hypothetical protein
MKNIYTLLILLVSVFSFVNAQTGPGGIGNADGSNGQPENLIWLDASGLSTFSLGDTLFDKSGNGYNAIHIDKGGGAPSLGTLNGFSTIDFGGKACYLRIADDNNGANRLDGMNKLTIMAVYDPGSVDTRALISKRDYSGTSTITWSFFHNSGTKMYMDAGSTRVGGGASLSGFGFGTSIVNGAVSNYYNGDLQSSGGSVSSIPDRSENVTIGIFEEGDTRYYDGAFAEIAVFSSGLNTAQKIIVENYFSTKYNLSFSTSSNDKFIGNGATYIYELAGIGQESDENQMESSSAGFYVTGDAGSLDNGEYIMFAHNNTANSVITTDVPSGVEARWARDWYVEKTGSQNATIKFDLQE